MFLEERITVYVQEYSEYPASNSAAWISWNREFVFFKHKRKTRSDLFSRLVFTCRNISNFVLKFLRVD